MRYLHVKAGVVINVVEHADSPPDTDEQGADIVADPTGTTNVGAAYDVTNDLRERIYSRYDKVVLKELFRLTNESRTAQGLAVFTVVQYKTFLKTQM
jgi:hypothetical protein